MAKGGGYVYACGHCVGCEMSVTKVDEFESAEVGVGRRGFEVLSGVCARSGGDWED